MRLVLQAIVVDAADNSGERAEKGGSTVEVASIVRMGKPRSERALVEGLERDWDRIMRVMS
jgi:hypothetical protein